jgi:DNA-binding IclR family transcriptional regulator
MCDASYIRTRRDLRAERRHVGRALMARSGAGAAAPNGSLTLERGLRVLRVLAERPDGLSVSNLARELSTHRAGVYRLLGPLSDQRLVARGEDGRFRLGMGLVDLAGAVRARLQEIAAPELQALADELGATTALTLRDGEEAVVAAVLEPRNSAVHIAYRTGLRHPLDQAASGIAILAELPPEPRERDAVTRARERGWSYSSGELLVGATGVGKAIASPGGGAEASISAVWIDERDEAQAAERLVAAAARIAAALQGNR